MSNLFIDPYVFACPQPDEGLEVFDDYIRSILTWRELNDVGWPALFISERTAEVLANTNSYPLWDSLSGAISQLNIQDIQAKDVVDLVNSLLTKLPQIEDHFAIVEVLAEQIRCTPDYHFIGRPGIFVESYERLAILICLITRFHNLQGNDQILITRSLEGDSSNSDTLASVIDIEASLATTADLPFDLEGHFLLCNTPHGLYLSINPISVWVTAENDETYKRAVQISVYQYVRMAGLAVDSESLPWSFGPRFLETASGLGFLGQEARAKMLLRAIAETILGERLNEMHALREGEGPNESQRTRDKDKAWRRNIDYEYHLHYWETANGPEMASVVVHNDMTIPP